MPMARPASVSVTQEETSPKNGRASTTSAGTRSIGSQSDAGLRQVGGGRSGGCGRGHWWASRLRPRRRCCRPASATRSRMAPAWTMRPSSMTSTPSPRTRGGVEILLHEQDRFARLLQRLERLDHVAHDHRREALRRLVDEEQAARLRDRAGDGEHLLLAAGQMAGRQAPEPLQGRKQREDPVEPRAVDRARPGGEHHVLADGQVAEDGHGFRHVGDAAPRDVGRRAARDVLALEQDAAARCLPEAHDGAQRRRLAGAVAPEQHGDAAPRHGEVHALQDVIGADMGVHAFEAQKGLGRGAGRSPSRRRYRRRSCGATPR